MSAVAFELDGYLAERRAPVEDALERAVAELEAMLPADEAAAVRHGVTSGGKRLRPVLCVTAYEACGGSAEPAAYDLAASLELIHCYSLMHDDLPCMDDAKLRRGRPTTHRVHGVDATIRAGAALIPAAARAAYRATRALGRDDVRARAVARLLLEASGGEGMVGGQWLDLEGEGNALPADDLDRLHRMKTGALLTASLHVGAAAADASGPVRCALVGYGRAVGLAFQVADDILDATADAGTLGKNPSDADLDKSTYVALHGVDAARARAEALVREAKQWLDHSGLDAPALAALADYVVDRRN